MMKGLITRKIGMTRVFQPDGAVVAATELRVEPNTVIRLRTRDKDGYDAVVLGVGGKKWKTRKGKEHVRYRAMKEFMLESLDGVSVGSMFDASSIPAKSLVTITGFSKGKGFQGVMKRHGFAGGPATHGSHFKREPGSIGMRNKPGKIFKGHRMAGRMGGDRITLKHRSVVWSDSGSGVIAIGGAVPGARGSLVYVTVEAAPPDEKKQGGVSSASSK
jgi:large subunit ribosomal protein L3